jgi:hypothetical protein
MCSKINAITGGGVHFFGQKKRKKLLMFEKHHFRMGDQSFKQRLRPRTAIQSKRTHGVNEL